MLIQEPLNFHAATADSIGLIPMHFRQTVGVIRKMDGGTTFKLAPAALTKSLTQGGDFANIVFNSDNLNVTDRAVNLKSQLFLLPCRE